MTQPIEELNMLSQVTEVSSKTVAVARHDALTARLAEGSRAYQVEDLEVANLVGELALSSPFLLRLSSDLIRYVVNRSTVRRTLAGAELRVTAAAHDVGLSLVLSGDVALIHRGGGTPRLVGPGECFGEAVITPAMNTLFLAMAESDSVVLEIPTEVISALMDRDASLDELIRSGALHSAANAVLATAELFSDVPPLGIHRLVDCGTLRTVDRRTPVVHQAGQCEMISIVLSGELAVIVPDDGRGWQTLETRGAGAIVGEMSLYGEKELAEIVAATDAVLLDLPRHNIGELLSTHPTFLERLTRVVDERRLAAQPRLSAA